MIDSKSIINWYSKTQSIKKTSKKTGVSEQSVRRTLVLAGLYSSPMSEKIFELTQQNLTPPEIATQLNIQVKTVQGYLPYQRGPYNEVTINAKNIAKWRKKRKSIE